MNYMNEAALKKDPRLRISLPPLANVITGAVLIFLVYALVTGMTYRFYASALFLFYSLIKKIWISVVMLGIFQTFLMVPLRIINMTLSKNTKEFEDKIVEL